MANAQKKPTRGWCFDDAFNDKEAAQRRATTLEAQGYYVQVRDEPDSGDDRYNVYYLQDLVKSRR